MVIVDYGILFGIISMAGFGLANAITQRVVKNVGTFSAMAWQSFSAAVFLSALFLIYPAGFSFSWQSMAMTAAIGLFGALPLFTFYKALSSGKVGMVVPIANSFGLFTILLSSLFLGEALSFSQLLSTAVIISGIALVSFKAGASLKGVYYALATAAMWGVYFFINVYPVAALGPIFAAVLTQAVISAFAFAYSMKKKLLKKPDNDVKKLIIISGAALATGVAGFNVGITMANVSVVVLLASAAPLVTVAYARVFYSERLTKLQYLAIAMILAGIAWLSM